MTTYKVGGITLPSAPIMIGAGVCKTPQTAREWLTVAPVVSGSYTPERRDGNKGDRLFYPDTDEELRAIGFGLNSFGMPNMGFKSAAQEFANHRSEHPLIISVAGFSVDDYANGIEQFTTVDGVAAVELNFGCPNTEHGKIMSFDIRSLDTLFRRLGESAERPIWVKFSPYSDPGLLKEVASVVNTASATIKAVVTCNTFPSAYAGKDAISPMGGLAGLSGPALKPIAMGQIIQFRQHLVPEIDVIGIGGATTGNDIVDFLDAGAQAMQMTSLPFWLGTPGRLWETLLDQNTGNRLETYLN
jgi:dihydroorotate dehydrogenase (fumarate)